MPPRAEVLDAGGVERLLRRFGLKADKALGQHFLVSRPAVEAILREAAPCAGVLEVGPGPGILTGPLADAHPVVAVELDRRWEPVLTDRAPEARIVFADALQTDLRPILVELPAPRAIVSNLPYYITGPLLAKFAEVAAEVDRMVLMMQTEVADRILARAGHTDRGALSVRLQRGFAIRRVIEIGPGAFLPPPKVRSTVLTLVPRRDVPPFGPLIGAGFAQRRKTLANNLSAHLRTPRDEVEDRLHSLGLDVRIRAQDLDEAAWEGVERAFG